MNPLISVLALALFLLFDNRVQAEAIPVEVVKKSGRYQLLRGGEPYEIKGAGMGSSDLGVFASHGGNSIRTWSTGNATRLLDEAHKHGITVALCISVRSERHGFDYDNPAAVAAQLESARRQVLKYKDHPALLAWIIGNEVNLNFKNPKVFNAVNSISRMIHSLDKNHPTTTALAGFDRGLAALIKSRAPDLDFISVQLYGGIVHLPDYIRNAGHKAPLLVTEWGSIGHWEVDKTSWGAPIEQNSTEKAETYLTHYQAAIASNLDQIMGSYVFLWGQKQERTPTWYSMFLPDGTGTEVVDVMHYVWKGVWPDNRSPRIKKMKLNYKTSERNIALKAGRTYKARVEAHDPDGDQLTYQWEVRFESEATSEGGDYERTPKAINGLIEPSEVDGSAVIHAPANAGIYRLFVYVHDGQGHAGHANIPFRVK